MIAFQEVEKDTQEVVDNFKQVVSEDFIKEVKKELNIT